MTIHGNNVSIFLIDVKGISDKISKARRTFNALTGIGIRKCGLTMSTHNLIFWLVVVPVAPHGRELTKRFMSYLNNFKIMLAR